MIPLVAQLPTEAVILPQLTPVFRATTIVPQTAGSDFPSGFSPIAVTSCSPAISFPTPTFSATPVNISGSLFNDPNGLTDGSVDGTLIGAASGTQLYANLVQSGAVVQSVLIPTSGGSVGTYTFANVTAGNYTVVIATSAAATTPALPAGWLNFGKYGFRAQSTSLQSSRQ